jgi:hypothetical protein
MDCLLRHSESITQHSRAALRACAEPGHPTGVVGPRASTPRASDFRAPGTRVVADETLLDLVECVTALERDLLPVLRTGPLWDFYATALASAREVRLHFSKRSKRQS